MPNWKLSRYTVIFRTESGDAIFHNSFMGALALVPSTDFAKIESRLNREIFSHDLQNNTLHELCQNLFFFPTGIDEKNYVTDILHKENKSGHFDIIILPHENCNFRCVYCYETHRRGRMEPAVVEGLKRFVEKKAAECKSLSIRWFGGEPLLAADIIDDLSSSFLASCAKSGVSYHSHMTTNAYLLTPTVFEQLIKNRIKDFQITLDGPEACHDTTRILAGGGKTFQTIYNNLLQMQQSDHDFSVSLRINFNDESIPLMEDFFASLSKTFGNDRRFGLYLRPIGKYGGPNDENIAVCEPDIAKVIEMDLSEKYLPYGYLDKLIKKSLQSHGQVCYAAKESSIVVGSDGTVYKCSVSFEDANNHVGKLLPDGKLEIDPLRWNLWVSNSYDKNHICDSCPVYPLCQGKYCPRSSIREQKPVCPMTRTTYSQLIQLAASSMAKFQ
ncbi:MAG TPA: radical SAM protein [Syntrophomonas sp.]|nr:radical SAM protein [Syntrophomonas sp.]